MGLGVYPHKPPLQQMLYRAPNNAYRITLTQVCVVYVVNCWGWCIKETPF